MLLLYTRAKYLSINKGRRKDWGKEKRLEGGEGVFQKC
jgi:hypothetical protein